jgi:hypothetical protein
VAVPPQIALAVVAAMSLFAIAFTVVVASTPSAPSPQLRALPVPGHPVWCACWWPTAPAGKLSG